MILIRLKGNVIALGGVEDDARWLGAPRSDLRLLAAWDRGIPTGFVRDRQLGFDTQAVAINLELIVFVD